MGHCDARGQNAAFVVVVDVEIRRNRRVERGDLHGYLRCDSLESWLVAAILLPQRSSRLSEEAGGHGEAFRIGESFSTSTLPVPLRPNADMSTKVLPPAT